MKNQYCDYDYDRRFQKIKNGCIFILYIKPVNNLLKY